MFRHFCSTAGKSSKTLRPLLHNKTNVRYVRIMAMNAEKQINMIPNTVAYKFIDREGGTKRFYRQVFLEKYREHKHDQHANGNASSSLLSSEDSDGDSESDVDTNTEINSFIIKLDDRILTINDSPIIIDNYDLALFCATEFETQGEYMRIESMPISEIICKLIERNLGLNAMPRDIQRQSWKESVKNRLEFDLLLTAENQYLVDKGFYERNWQPLIAWFNQTFELNLKLDYIIMHDENADDYNAGSAQTQQSTNATKPTQSQTQTDVETIMNPQTMYDLNIDDILDNYQGSQISKNINYLTNKYNREYKYEYGLIPQFLASLDDVRLMMIDDMIRYCYSPIIAIAIVTNVIAIDDVLNMLSKTPELDIQMIVANEEDLKLNQTNVNLITVRNFLNCWDQIVPLCDNKIVNKYEEPLIRL